MQRPAGGTTLLDKGRPLVAGQARLEAGGAFDQRLVKKHTNLTVAEVSTNCQVAGIHSGGLVHLRYGNTVFERLP